MKYFVLALVLSGCGASLPADTLVSMKHGLDGSKEFYYAFCENPPADKVDVCEKGGNALNLFGKGFNVVNELFGEEE